MLKDSGECLDKEMHRFRSGRVVSSCTWMCLTIWKVSEPHISGIFMDASSHRDV
jgi:hypothetical protein